MQKISLSLGHDDLTAIDQIAAQFIMARRHAVARAALRAGLDQMARDYDFAREHLMREAGIVGSEAK